MMTTPRYGGAHRLEMIRGMPKLSHIMSEWAVIAYIALLLHFSHAFHSRLSTGPAGCGESGWGCS